MNRRSFLKGLLGTTALVALPVAVLAKPAPEATVFTVKYYTKSNPAATFKMYATFEKGLKIIEPGTYSFKLKTPEFTE